MQILAGVGAVQTFTYHVFTSSGTLTVTSGGVLSLCTVGGAGGGGENIGGAGGGGELDLFADFTVASNLTITIGGGGANSTNPNVRGAQGGTSTVVEGVTTHQSALGGGGGGSYLGQETGGAGGSGGGGNGNAVYAGGAASGSNTNAGGTSSPGGAVYRAGGGGGAVAAASTGTGGQGYALTSIDTNLTTANFPTTLTGKTHVSSGGGGGTLFVSGSHSVSAGGTNAGTGGLWNNATSTDTPATAPTSYGCGGAGMGNSSVQSASTSGFAGVVIVRYITGLVAASGGQETVTNLPA
jgi:hypothetical protein